ncbi:STAS domain-containing protein [Magnetospirillum fulvum]|uniref:Anti-anti-sigma regulatory factor (Antagonist of anti-sigma factor) n=1 Tax=Magnetospirillum fulvum TaxID=1082 RepID=A0A1H6H9D3_MAGFU|nr:STAS domain-containing protein [Magnetospirillum fulvum]SEH30874.1 Anti-anti-sigma regulatory factor (antagonist of anti-sigma factor) [Magnetospirillum fulvum]
MSLIEDAVTVACSGELCLPRAEEIRDTLLAALDQAQPVVIDLSQATEIDLSTVQLILAARLSAERRGLSLWLTSPADGPLAATLLAAGLTGSPLSTDSQFRTEGK